MFTRHEFTLQAVATAHKLPWKLLLDAKNTNLDEVSEAHVRLIHFYLIAKKIHRQQSLDRHALVSAY